MLTTVQKLRCAGSNGAVVRSGRELDTAFVGEINTLDVCTAVEHGLASNGVERVRLSAPVAGWASRRLFEELGGDTVRVDYKAGDVTLKRLVVRVDGETTMRQVKQSLAAMTNLPVESQQLFVNGEEVTDSIVPDHLVLKKAFRYETGTHIPSRFPSAERKLNFGALPPEP